MSCKSLTTLSCFFFFFPWKKRQQTVSICFYLRGIWSPALCHLEEMDYRIHHLDADSVWHSLYSVWLVAQCSVFDFREFLYAFFSIFSFSCPFTYLYEEESSLTFSLLQTFRVQHFPGGFEEWAKREHPEKKWRWLPPSLLYLQNAL